MGFLRRIIQPFRSRKVRVGLTTVIVAVLAEWKFNVSSGVMLSIVSAGVAIILSIAHEDNGRYAALGHPNEKRRRDWAIEVIKKAAEPGTGKEGEANAVKPD